MRSIWAQPTVLVALAGVLLSSPRPATPQGPAAAPVASVSPAVPGKDKPKAIVITPEREAAVNTFVRLHHPDLADLLSHLKTNQRKEFDRAVRELYRVSENLAQLQERDQERHALELRRWKAQSRVHLLTARLRMGDSEDLKRQLKESLFELRDVRVALLELDRVRAAERLQKAEAELARLRSSGDASIEAQLRQLLQLGGDSGKLKRDLSEGALSDKRPSAKRPPAAAVAPGPTTAAP